MPPIELLASHTYAQGGSYAVTLTVVDGYNVTASLTQMVAVAGPPAASFGASCSGLGCSFDASGSTPGTSPIAAYTWIFGDGTSGSGVTVSHAYAAAGSYTVTLTVTDTQGRAATQSQRAVATPPAAASFTFRCSLLACTFDGSGSHAANPPIVSYGWSFGDSNNGSGVAPAHGYAASGLYVVTLNDTQP